MPSMYSIEGDKVVKKNPYCPRCGPGTFMADHKDRFVCGKCAYTQSKKMK